MNQLLNKIRGSLLIFISVIFVALFAIEATQGHSQDQFLLSVLSLFSSIGLVIYGIRLWSTERRVNLLETLIVLFILEFLAFLMISFHYATHIVYFPILFLLALLYSVAIENKRIFRTVNIICIGIIFAGEVTISQFFDTSVLVSLSSVLLQCSIYFSIVFVIRNYFNECLTCELKKDSCPFQDSCIFYQARWKNHF